MDDALAARVQVALAFEGVVDAAHQDDALQASVRGLHEELRRAGVRANALETGEAQVVFGLVGSLLGRLVDFGATVAEAAEWVQSARWPSLREVPALARAQVDRLLGVARDELARLGGDADVTLDCVVTYLATTMVASGFR